MMAVLMVTDNNVNGIYMDLDHEIDWGAGAELTGCSKLQTKFVQGLCAGLNQTRAALAAGYKGEGAALRGAASRLAKSNKVRALLAWAKAGGAGPSDVPGSLDELKKILWRHARSADKNHSIKATEVLHRLDAQERERGTAPTDDGFGPDRFARDMMLANQDGAASLLLFLSRGLALSRMPLFHDLAPRVRDGWPEIWKRLLARQSDVMRQDLDERFADPLWQRETREFIWGELGWVIGSDNVAKPDPLGRSTIAPTKTLDTEIDADTPAVANADGKANGQTAIP